MLFKACLPLFAYLSSCQTPHFYRPKPVEPVLLTQSRQSKINLISDKDNFTAVSIGYSPAEHLGLAAGTGVFTEEQNQGESYFNPYISAGYYKKLSANTLIETYGGIGLYNYKNKDDAALRKINFHNYFVQPSFAFVQNNIEVALTLRVDYLKRYKTQFGNNYPPDTADFHFAFLKYNDYLFFQPGCTVRFGFKYFKLQMQATKSNPFNNKYASIYGTVYHSRAHIEIFDHPIKWSGGVTVDLAVIKKKKSEIPPDQ